MPQGVEHYKGQALSFVDADGPLEPLMLQGVEHSNHTRVYHHRPTPLEPLMPQGVEHTMAALNAVFKKPLEPLMP